MHPDRSCIFPNLLTKNYRLETGKGGRRRDQSKNTEGLISVTNCYFPRVPAKTTDWPKSSFTRGISIKAKLTFDTDSLGVGEKLSIKRIQNQGIILTLTLCTLRKIALMPARDS